VVLVKVPAVVIMNFPSVPPPARTVVSFVPKAAIERERRGLSALENKGSEYVLRHVDDFVNWIIVFHKVIFSSILKA
jgi:hypothetical protein